MENKESQTGNQNPPNPAKQAIDFVCARSFYKYLTDISNLKGYRAVIEGLQKACQTCDSEALITEARENIGSFMDEVRKLEESLKIEAVYANMHKEALEKHIRETISHEWIEIVTYIGKYNTKITLIQNAL